MGNSLRAIREEPGFKESLAEIGISLEDWDVVSEGLYFVLARTPEIFKPPRKKSPLRLAGIRLFKDLPPINILFAYNDDLVVLLDAYLGGVDEG